MRPNKILILAILALFLSGSFSALMAREKSGQSVKPVIQDEIGDPYDPALDADPWDDDDDGGPGLLEIGPGIVIFDLPKSGWSFYKFSFISVKTKPTNGGAVTLVKPVDKETTLAK